jgi:hypothetical protein
MAWYGNSAGHSKASRGIKSAREKLGRKVYRSNKIEHPYQRHDIITLSDLRNKDLPRKPSGPGKFEGCYNADLTEALYDTVMDGFVDEEIGSVQEQGWYGLIRDVQQYHIKIDGKEIVGAIVAEDSNGFFEATTYYDKNSLMKDWENILEEYSVYGEE